MENRSMTKATSGACVQRNPFVSEGGIENQDLEKYLFPEGVYGFEANQNYILSDFEDKTYAPFQVLFNMRNPLEFFIVLGIGQLDERLFNQEDLEKAADELGLPFEKVGFYVLVTANKVEGTLSFRANLRAPLALSKSGNEGYQHIFHQKDYACDYLLKEISENIQRKRSQKGN